MHLRTLTTTSYWYYIWVHMSYHTKTRLRCQILMKVLIWGNNDWYTRLLAGNLFPGACLAGGGEKDDVSVSLAAMPHASACWSWLLLMLLDSHLQILLSSDPPLKNYFLDSWLKRGLHPSAAGLYSPMISGRSFFRAFPAGWLRKSAILSPISLHMPLPMPCSQKNWPQTHVIWNSMNYLVGYYLEKLV